MADENTGVKISLLPTASNLQDANVLAGVQGNSTKKFSLSAIKAFIIEAITAAGIGAVPDTRKVNNKALSSDITLDSTDVGARSSNWLPTPNEIGAEPQVQLGSVDLSSSWSGNGPYSQSITITGATVTANSKVDIQLTSTQISSLIFDGVTGLVIENNGGNLTAYAVGAQPAAMNIQVTVIEVET